MTKSDTPIGKIVTYQDKIRKHFQKIEIISEEAVLTKYPMYLKKDGIEFSCVNTYDLLENTDLSPTQISATILQTAQLLFPDTIGRYPPKSEVRDLDAFRKNRNAFAFDEANKEWIIDTGVPDLGEISIPVTVKENIEKCYGVKWLSIDTVNPSSDRLERSTSTIATTKGMMFKDYAKLPRPIRHAADQNITKTVSGTPRSATILKNDRILLSGRGGAYQSEYAGWEWRDAIIKLLANHQDKIKSRKMKLIKNGLECICLAGPSTCGDHYNLWVDGRADLTELEDFKLKSKTPIEIFDHIHFNMESLKPLIHIDKKEGGGVHYLCLPPITS